MSNRVNDISLQNATQKTLHNVQHKEPHVQGQISWISFWAEKLNPWELNAGSKAHSRFDNVSLRACCTLSSHYSHCRRRSVLIKHVHPFTFRFGGRRWCLDLLPSSFNAQKEVPNKIWAIVAMALIWTAITLIHRSIWSRFFPVKLIWKCHVWGNLYLLSRNIAN